MAVVDRDRVLVARHDAAAERQHERVVGEHLAALGVGLAGVRIDPRELVDDQLGARVGDDRRELVALGPG